MLYVAPWRTPFHITGTEGQVAMGRPERVTTSLPPWVVHWGRAGVGGTGVGGAGVGGAGVGGAGVGGAGGGSGVGGPAPQIATSNLYVAAARLRTEKKACPKVPSPLATAQPVKPWPEQLPGAF